MVQPMRKSQTDSNKTNHCPIHIWEDYPLQGTALDVPLAIVLALPQEQRTKYIHDLLEAFQTEIANDRMTLKKRVTFKREMRDLRKLLHEPADKFLYTDDQTFKRDILAKGAPGSTHVYWSRLQMWKTKTKCGDLANEIAHKAPRLVASLERLFNPNYISKEQFRYPKKSAVVNAIDYLETDRSLGIAFPPFHAKFFADRYLPLQGDGIVVDPCAGWGGRLLGTLCVHRTGHVRYYGVDPERNNQETYDGLVRRINIWLEKELYGKRSARVFCAPFEDWIRSKSAARLLGRTDLVITSPPYFSAENYNPANNKQSANRYRTYADWRERFYRPLVQGAYDLLKPGGVFVLNIANVAKAPTLEDDARSLAHDVGFENSGFFKLAMSIVPGTRTSQSVRHAVFVNGKQYKYEPVFVFRRPSSSAKPRMTS